MSADNTSLLSDNLQSRTIEWLRYPLMVLIVIIHTDTALLLSMPVGSGFSPVLYGVLRTVIRIAVPMFFFFRATGFSDIRRSSICRSIVANWPSGSVRY